MSAADQVAAAAAGIRPDPAQEPFQGTDPKTGIDLSVDPFQHQPITAVPQLNIPLPATGPVQLPGTQQSVPGTDLSRDPFDQSGSPKQLELERQSRERSAAIEQAAAQQLPPKPSEGSLPMTVGTRYNPNGSPTGVTVAPPTQIQDSYTPDFESGGPVVAAVPGTSAPISLAPGTVIDPVADTDATRPALGDPSGPSVAEQIGPLKKSQPVPFGFIPAGGAYEAPAPDSIASPMATGVTSASSPLDYLPLVAAVVVAFLILRGGK